MKFEHSTTNRGFSLIEFFDRYQQKCSIQKSSLATDDAIWFGVDEGLDINGNIERNGSIYSHQNNRMLLTREQVSELIPWLQHFVDWGTLDPVVTEPLSKGVTKQND